MTTEADFTDFIPQEARGWLGRLHTPTDSSDEQGRIAIAGLPKTGQVALYNSLWGWDAIREADSTTPIRPLGLFSLVELPSHPQEASNLLLQLGGVELIVLVITGDPACEQAYFEWLAQLKNSRMKVMVVCNLNAYRINKNRFDDLQRKLGMGALPLNVDDPQSVHERFLQGLLKVCPSVSVALAREIGKLRHRVAQQLIARGALTSVALTLEQTTIDDHAMLVDLQLRLVTRIATVYGCKQQAGYERFLLTTALRTITRFLLRVYINLPKSPARFGPSAINVLTTLVIGYGAMLYHGMTIQDLLPARFRQPDAG
ncbi:MAG: hypothetical protein SFZ02_12500 [bacterium]|nr:hypothetical protein [bacterium]